MDSVQFILNIPGCLVWFYPNKYDLLSLLESSCEYIVERLKTNQCRRLEIDQ